MTRGITKERELMESELTNELYKLSNELEEIFNVGLCNNCPSVKHEKCGWSDNRGCCSFCGIHKGFFIHTYKRAKIIRTIFKFDKEYGFFDAEKKCCKLPWHMRSNQCLSYMCEDLANTIGDINCTRVYKIVDRIYDIKTNLGIER